MCVSLVACKKGRRDLEQLVPDGATGLVSIDAKALVQTELYTSTKAVAAGLLSEDAKPGDALGTVRDECGVDLEKADSIVIGFDLISKNGMGAIRTANVGKADALRCVEKTLRGGEGAPTWGIGESDGKTTITIDGGRFQGWAMDDDTLVLSSAGWSQAVHARIKGESKGAVDNSLKEAVALADRSKHIWFAGEVPAIMESFLTDTPASGLRRIAGSLDGTKGLDISVALELSDEASAKALEEVGRAQLEQLKGVALVQGVPQEILDTFVLEADGAFLRSSISLSAGAATGAASAIVVPAFEKYASRSKSAEARVQVAKMVDAAVAYFNEEHVARGPVDVIGFGGSITDIAPHACPNDGRLEGEAGMTPPLTVDCSEGPGGRCVPTAGGGGGPGAYDSALFSDNPVWNALNFQQDQAHYFHYNFRWRNLPEGFGGCQFTAQAFGDLDGDGVFSTYERSGAADENGVNLAAGLYIDREVE